MRLNKRVGIETIISTFVVILILIGWNIAGGMLATLKYAPEVQQMHTSGVASQVEFGSVTSASGSTIALCVGGIMLFAVVYYVLRSYFAEKSKNKNKSK